MPGPDTRIPTQDLDGALVMVLFYLPSESDTAGAYRLEDGSEVKALGDGSFEIVSSGTVLRQPAA